MDNLETLDNGIRKILGSQGILTNVALNLKSCGCRTLNLAFNCLMLDTFKQKSEEILSAIHEYVPEWHVYYISALPGTNRTKKVSLREFCDSCKNKYNRDQKMGMNTILVDERL